MLQNLTTTLDAGWEVAERQPAGADLQSPAASGEKLWLPATVPGHVHTDLMRGFVRAEVVHYDDLISLGGMNEAKSKGKLRLEGKEYLVKDGDIVHIRSSL